MFWLTYIRWGKKKQILTKNLEKCSEDLGKILMEKEILFQKITTAHKEKKEREEANPKKGWFSSFRSGLSNQIIGKSNKTENTKENFIQTSSGKIEKKAERKKCSYITS